MFQSNTIKVSDNEIFIFTGNCVELAARGILNGVPCKMNFSNGCPDTFFFSSDLYKCTFHSSIYSLYNTGKKSFICKSNKLHNC